MSADARRAAILDAALEVFSRRGYHAAAIDEIARSAGISKALIYEHFPSKKDLHASLLERYVDDIFRTLERAATEAGAGELRLRAGVEAFLEWVETRPQAFRLLFRDVFETEVAEVLTRLQRQSTAGVADLIARGQAGAADRSAIEVFAQLLSGSVQSLAVWWQDHPDVGRAQLVDRVMDFAWTGLERIASRHED